MAHHILLRKSVKPIVRRASYQIIEHTADIGIRVTGRDLKALFINTARAMFDLIAAPDASLIKKTQNFKVAQTADNLEGLLVNWLNELLSLASAKHVIFLDYKITALTETSLTASVTGADEKACSVEKEIKAATYHALKVLKTKSGFEAQIIFDV